MSRKKKSPDKTVTHQKPYGLITGTNPGRLPSGRWTVSASVEVPESGLCPKNTRSWPGVFSGQPDSPAKGKKKTETASVNFGQSGKIDFTVRTGNLADLSPLLLRACRLSQLSSEEKTVLFNSGCSLVDDASGRKAASGAPGLEAVLRRIKAKLGCSTNEQMVHLLFAAVPVRRDNSALTEDQKTYLANLAGGKSPSQMSQSMGLDRRQLRNLRRAVKILYGAETGCAIVYKHLLNTGNLNPDRNVRQDLGLLGSRTCQAPEDRTAL
ncbi:MAG: hypothetical protein LBP22_14485 [Deltaproteobacteria bacterium]|jgi:DNA-binding CsgD family transcriptional regulator|nr:hypothetical protein [Deltaproteobacteria bacterium]